MFKKNKPQVIKLEVSGQRFAIGEEVYTMYDNKITKEKITSVFTNGKEFMYSITDYSNREFYKHQFIKQTEIFKTKEALIESIS